MHGDFILEIGENPMSSMLSSTVVLVSPRKWSQSLSIVPSNTAVLLSQKR